MGSGADISVGGLPLSGGTLTGPIVGFEDKGGQVYNVKAYGATVDGATNDTASINLATAAAHAAGGGTVLVSSSATSATCIIAGVILYSNVTLKIGDGVTLTRNPGYTGHLIYNEGLVSLASASDGAITSGSAVLTTALSSRAKVGQTIIVGTGQVASPAGAGKGGSLLVANIISIGTGTVTLSVAAQTTTTAAVVNLYNRDHDIAIDFGAGANIYGGLYSGPIALGPLPVYFRHVDRIALSGIATISDESGSVDNGGFCFGDCTDIDIPYATTGAGTLSGCIMRFDGPCTDITIGTVTGTVTGDDGVTIMPSELGAFYANYDTGGPISNVNIDAIYVNCSTNNNGNDLRLTSSLEYGCPLSNINVGTIVATGSSLSACLMSTNPDPTNSVDFNKIHLGHMYGQVSVSGTGPVDSLVVDFITVPANAGNGSAWLALGNQTIGVLHVKGASYTGTVVVHLADIGNATVDTLILEGFDWTETTTGQSACLHAPSSAATINTAVIGPGTWNAGTIVYNTIGCVITRVFYRDVTGGGASRIGDFKSTTDLFLNGVDAPAGGAGLIVETGGAVTIRGSGINNAPPTYINGTLTVKTLDWAMDVSEAGLIQHKGDMVTNTNAALSCGAGPVISDGTHWKPAIGFVTAGTAVLAAGTVAVANTAITAASIIKVWVLTPGVTVGAPFVSVVTAGTGFTITSTSGTDTSVIRYEIESY